MGILIVLGILASLVFEDKDPTPRGALAKAAGADGYRVAGNSVFVPYRVLPAEKLAEWKRISQEQMHVVTDGMIRSVSVKFDDFGMEVEGVSIDWNPGEKTCSFTWHLTQDETAAFVKKAIAEMRR